MSYLRTKIETEALIWYHSMNKEQQLKYFKTFSPFAGTCYTVLEITEKYKSYLLKEKLNNV